jgi:hypothetical protein
MCWGIYLKFYNALGKLVTFPEYRENNSGETSRKKNNQYPSNEQADRFLPFNKDLT